MTLLHEQHQQQKEFGQKLSIFKMLLSNLPLTFPKLKKKKDLAPLLIFYSISGSLCRILAKGLLFIYWKMWNIAKNWSRLGICISHFHEAPLKAEENEKERWSRNWEWEIREGDRLQIHNLFSSPFFIWKCLCNQYVSVFSFIKNIFWQIFQ